MLKRPVEVATAIELANWYLKLPLREDSGKNRSKEIDELNRWAGVPLGSPYCAVGVSACFDGVRLISEKGLLSFPSSASSQEIRRIFESCRSTSSIPPRMKPRASIDSQIAVEFPFSSKIIGYGNVEGNKDPKSPSFGCIGLRFKNAQLLLKCSGALFGWTNLNDKSHGHIGFVIGRLTDSKGKVIAFQTLEFNTNLNGSRDGEGCYSLTRKVHDRYWFLDTTPVRGGQWFKQH